MRDAIAASLLVAEPLPVDSSQFLDHHTGQDNFAGVLASLEETEGEASRRPVPDDQDKSGVASILPDAPLQTLLFMKNQNDVIAGLEVARRKLGFGLTAHPPLELYSMIMDDINSTFSSQGMLLERCFTDQFSLCLHVKSPRHANCCLEQFRFSGPDLSDTKRTHFLKTTKDQDILRIFNLSVPGPRRALDMKTAMKCLSPVMTRLRQIRGFDVMLSSQLVIKVAEIHETTFAHVPKGNEVLHSDLWSRKIAHEGKTLRYTTLRLVTENVSQDYSHLLAGVAEKLGYQNILVNMVFSGLLNRSFDHGANLIRSVKSLEYDSLEEYHKTFSGLLQAPRVNYLLGGHIVRIPCLCSDARRCSIVHLVQRRRTQGSQDVICMKPECLNHARKKSAEITNTTFGSDIDDSNPL